MDKTRDGNQFLYKVVLVFQNFGLMISVLVLVFKILQNNFGFGFGFGFQNFGLMILVLVFKIFNGLLVFVVLVLVKKAGFHPCSEESIFCLYNIINLWVMNKKLVLNSNNL